MSGQVARLAGRRRGSRVVVTFPLSADAAAHLLEALGPAVELVDVKASDGSEEIVLVPSSSRQLTGRLRSLFPHATLLVVEVEDAAHGVRFGGQVLRTLDAGADGYFVARSLDELAAIIERSAAPAEVGEKRGSVGLPPASDSDLSSILDELRRRRQPAARPENA